MITHYGLFWSERDVFWGKQGAGNYGRLLGREKEPLGRRGAPTKTERDNAQDYGAFVGLYALFGSKNLVYVGEAGLDTKQNIFERLRQHRKGSLADRWDQFSWFGRKTSLGGVIISTALAQLEAISIAITNPGHNKQSGSFAGAVQVFQVPGEKAEGDTETKLDRLQIKVDLILNKMEVLGNQIDSIG